MLALKLKPRIATCRGTGMSLHPRLACIDIQYCCKVILVPACNLFFCCAATPCLPNLTPQFAWCVILFGQLSLSALYVTDALSRRSGSAASRRSGIICASSFPLRPSGPMGPVDGFLWQAGRQRGFGAYLVAKLKPQA